MSLHVTPRETQVIELLNAGLSQKEIGEALQLSTGTVDTHIKNVKTKTGLQKATELTCAYTWHKYQLPLLDLPEQARKRIAMALLVLSIYSMVVESNNMLRVMRTNGRINTTTRTVRASRARRSRNNEVHYLAMA